MVGVKSIECSQCKLWVHKKCSGLTGRLVADLEFVCQSVKGVEVLLVQLMVDLLPMWMWTAPNSTWKPPSAIWATCFRLWWLRSRYCCSLLCGLGQVQKAIANPHFKAHLFQDTQQGVHSLCSVNYAPWQ